MTKAYQGRICVKFNDQWTHVWFHRGIKPPDPGLTCSCGHVKWADMIPSDIERRDDIPPLWVNGEKYERSTNDHSQGMEETEDAMGED